ncbi:hypothetical protein DAPPUDRAFT_108952 [Daphnia pulex]|uniref:cAMP-dependent protein kinase type II regulatory subunit n=1 Tax=Daphnia pulex TaxID=6669 RepID=E9H1B8_DAPPU|nr:hypothetical protein DAPPUDRAFT_108952 [Daphnia pulex]|eukprot:EFX74447.1 hypothetical protein DAPPUDRAFT_108952 [Daphnia pulex]
MSRDAAASRYEIPGQLQQLLLDFTVSCLVERPADLVDFAADYFAQLRQRRTEQQQQQTGGGGGGGLVAGSAAHGNGHGPESDDSMLTDESDEPSPESLANRFNRRKSVFAESYDPEGDDDEGEKVVHPKSDQQRHRLAEAVKNIFIFRSLDPDQVQDVLDAMFEKTVDSGDYVIRQGDDGDNFYVIDSGAFHIYVATDTEPTKRLVGQYEGSGSFGELALMYNMPRAATVQAMSHGSLWAMDRTTFRRIILKTACKKRKMYETLLETVPMLRALTSYERMNVADALNPRTFEDGECIIRQGDAADGMYFVETGTVRIAVAGENEIEVEVSRVTKGGYVGELALVTHRPRAASAYCVGPVRLAFLDVQAFERLMGPCMNIMKRNIDDYEDQLVRIFGSRFNMSDFR